jgi:hypothetical protein
MQLTRERLWGCQQNGTGSSSGPTTGFCIIGAATFGSASKGLNITTQNINLPLGTS